jgi:hypothetical protein
MDKTLGQRRVRVAFNPGRINEVDKIKAKAAEFIDFCYEMQGRATNEEARVWALAMTAMEEAAMWAVKAMTTPEEEKR